MKTLSLWPILVLALSLVLACPGPDVRDDRDTDPAGDGGLADLSDGQDGASQPADVAPERPPLKVVARPAFDPAAPAPCESHTACYLGAKEAIAAGSRAGFLRTLDLCEHYRGAYQLENFYGLCLLLLADSYRHLNNFEESARCYERFLQTQSDDADLALQARASLDEVEQGQTLPFAYSDYLSAVALLTRYSRDGALDLLQQAHALLSKLAKEQTHWPLTEKVDFYLDRIEKIQADKPDKADKVDKADKADKEPAAQPVSARDEQS